MASFTASSDSSFVGCADQCDFYCDIVATNCFGSNKLYDDKTECRKYCAGQGSPAASGFFFPVTSARVTGAAGGTNSLECRTYHAQLAASDADSHCPHASYYGGDGMCGDFCEYYCGVMAKSCSGSNEQFTTFEGYLSSTNNNCLATCRRWPTGSYNRADTSSDNRDCHLYHALAAALDPGTHCKHAGPTGGGVCGGRCEVYCREMQDVCGALSPFTDTAQCMTECSYFPSDDSVYPTETNHDHLQCRMFHVAFAAEGPSFSLPKTRHCPHASPFSGPGNRADDSMVACADECEYYCDVITANCLGETGAPAWVTADKSTCVTWCKVTSSAEKKI
jgi:hypothetical protein